MFDTVASRPTSKWRCFFSLKYAKCVRTFNNKNLFQWNLDFPCSCLLLHLSPTWRYYFIHSRVSVIPPNRCHHWGTSTAILAHHSFASLLGPQKLPSFFIFSSFIFPSDCDNGVCHQMVLAYGVNGKHYFGFCLQLLGFLKYGAVVLRARGFVELVTGVSLAFILPLLSIKKSLRYLAHSALSLFLLHCPCFFWERAVKRFGKAATVSYGYQRYTLCPFHLAAGSVLLNLHSWCSYIKPCSYINVRTELLFQARSWKLHISHATLDRKMTSLVLF